MKKMRTWAGLLLALAAIILTSCAEKDLPPKQEDGVLVYACMNPQNSRIQSYVRLFNEAHEDVQIELRDYSGEEGVQRLRVELAAGRIPDIMDLHYFGEIVDRGWNYDIPTLSDAPEGEYWMPYRQLVQKGYLEDLWPYIENDPELGRDEVLLPPLQAAEVNGGLYMLFQEVRINTLMGAESVVGARYGWTFEELMEAFSAMPADSTILRYNVTAWEVFSKLLCFSLDRYVDWETGECFFNEEGFRGMLAFLQHFPAEFDSPEDAEEAALWYILTGRQMLEGIQLNWPSELMYCDSLWGEPASFVGYPTTDGCSGSFFIPRESVLAMSSTCRDKEAAWDFMRQLIRPHYNISSVLTPGVSIPVNLSDYEKLIRAELLRADEHRKKQNSMIPLLVWSHFSESTYPKIHPKGPISEEGIQRYEDLLYHTTQLYWPDDKLSDIVWDSVGPYLAGHKTMDDTIALLQDRVTLYINEQK